MLPHSCYTAPLTLVKCELILRCGVASSHDTKYPASTYTFQGFNPFHLDWVQQERVCVAGDGIVPVADDLSLIVDAGRLREHPAGVSGDQIVEILHGAAGVDEGTTARRADRCKHIERSLSR